MAVKKVKKCESPLKNLKRKRVVTLGKKSITIRVTIAFTNDSLCLTVGSKTLPFT
jgi:hypothetical protein